MTKQLEQLERGIILVSEGGKPTQIMADTSERGMMRHHVHQRTFRVGADLNAAIHTATEWRRIARAEGVDKADEWVRSRSNDDAVEQARRQVARAVRVEAARRDVDGVVARYAGHRHGTYTNVFGWTVTHDFKVVP